MAHRKIHSNAWETALSPEQQQQAWELCRDLGYAKAAHLIAREFKIKAPSLAGLSRFYERMARIHSERSIEKALVDVSNFGNLAAKLPDITAAKRAALEKGLLDALVTGDPERIKLFAEICLKTSAQDAETTRLRILVEKHETAKQAALDALAGAKGKGGLTADTVAAIEEKLRLL